MRWPLSDWALKLLGRRRPTIPLELWQSTIDRHPFLQGLTAANQSLLRQRSEEFLHRIAFTGMDGLLLTDAMVVDIAAQACLPVLHRGLGMYAGLHSIYVYPGPVRVQREVVDAAGVVHTTDEMLVGEVMDGGPMLLCWDEGVNAAGTSPATGPAFNVVIHEFVHLLDATNGAMDGRPAMRATAVSEWTQALQEAFDRFDERRVCGYSSVLDAYGAHDLVEFFAVAAEAYFVEPQRFSEEFPALSQCFRAWFSSDR